MVRRSLLLETQYDPAATDQWVTGPACNASSGWVRYSPVMLRRQRIPRATKFIQKWLIFHPALVAGMKDRRGGTARCRPVATKFCPIEAELRAPPERAQVRRSGNIPRSGCGSTLEGHRLKTELPEQLRPFRACFSPFLRIQRRLIAAFFIASP
jgi:hypothetical protein